MSIINNYNFNNLQLRLSNNEYYDFILSSDNSFYSSGCSCTSSGSCLVVWYDINNTTIYPSGNTSENTVYSLVYWSGATNTGYTFNTIGLTGIDNGLITFNKLSGDTGNTALLSALTASTLVITSGDSRLKLTRVTGMTENYVYPITRVENSGATLGSYVNLCGGFYQGYYKIDGYSYEVLPNRINEGFTLDFWLNRTNSGCTGTTGTTLNDTYPNNKGFFFYIGTRAENKFWNVFEGNNTGCTVNCDTPSGCTGTVTTFCTIPKETDIILSSGYPLSPPPINIIPITNNFLLYNRSNYYSNNCNTCGGIVNPNHYGYSYPAGLTVCGCNSGTTATTYYMTATTKVITDTRNPFLVYRRGGSLCDNICGTQTNNDVTTCNFSGFTSDLLELDVEADVIDNALGFRIKDDGSIGYRLLKLTGYCSGNTYVTGVTVEEQYSASGTVSADVWTNIVIRFKTNYLDDCDLTWRPRRKGKLMFYINGKLKYVVNDFPEFVARRLNEYKDKQIGVPFNISLGGGTQSLLESMTFDGQDTRDLGLAIQNSFAGSFIGSLSQFKFYICDLSWCTIKDNFNNTRTRYNV